MILDDPNDRALIGLQTPSSQLHKILQPGVPPDPSPPPYSLIAPEALSLHRRSRERRQRRAVIQFSAKSIVTYAASISVLLNCLLIVLLIHVTYRMSNSGDSAGYAHGVHVYRVDHKTERVVRRNTTELSSTSHLRRGGGGLGVDRTREGRGSSRGGQSHRRGDR